MSRPIVQQPGSVTLDSLFSQGNASGQNAAGAIKHYIDGGQSNLLAPDALAWYQGIPNPVAYINGQTSSGNTAPTANTPAPATSTTAPSAPDSSMIEVSAGKFVGVANATQASIDQAKAFNPNQPGLTNTAGAGATSSPSLGITPAPLGSTAMTNQLLGYNAFDPATGAATGATKPTTATTPTPDGGLTTTSSGNAQVDAMIASLKSAGDALIASGKIPDNLQPTPALMQDFLSYAHSQADPYTQQLINNALPNINSNLNNLSVKYGNDMSQMIQDFGTNLNTEQNNSGNSGTAFSGLRNLTERNMVNSTNRQLSTLGTQASTDIGNTLRTGAADVGSANVGGFNLPVLAGGSVSLGGGSRGSSTLTSPLDFNYNPANYTVGNIQSGQDAIANQQGQAYNSAYGTLATQYPGRTMKDLAGQVVGSAGNNLFNNLQ